MYYYLVWVGFCCLQANVLQLVIGQICASLSNLSMSNQAVSTHANSSVNDQFRNVQSATFSASVYKLKIGFYYFSQSLTDAAKFQSVINITFTLRGLLFRNCQRCWRCEWNAREMRGGAADIHHGKNSCEGK